MAEVRYRALIGPAALAACGFLARALAPDLPLPPMAAGVVRAAGGVAGWLALAWFGARLADAWVDRARGTSEELPRLLGDLTRFVLFGLAAVAILTFVFEESATGLIATSGVMVAVLGFALRNMITDIVSGIALNMEHPYRLGDWVEPAPGIVGKVVEISWRSTRLITNDDTSVVIPNGLIAGNRFVNFSYPDRRYRTHVKVCLDASVPVDRAKRVLLAGALTAPGILAEPEPEVQALGINDRGVSYVVRYWVADYQRDNLCRDAVTTGLLRSLHRAGLAPAFPKQELVVAGQAPAPARRGPDLAALLRQVPLLEDFTDAEIRTLAEQLEERRYTAGQPVVRQGDPGGSLFLLAEGVLDVHAALDGQGQVRLDRMMPGDVFGEMSLLTGQPRTATVVAATDAIVYEIDKDHLEPILRARPDLSDRLGAVMAERQRANAERRRRLDDRVPPPQDLKNGRPLFDRLRHLFRSPP